MANVIKKMIEDKKEYHEQMARVAKLPEDYQFVFEKMTKYMWQFAGGDGMEMLRLHYKIIDLFEEGVAEGKQVLEITGDDVAQFCDDLLADTKKWTDKYRKKLNKSIKKKVSKGGD